MDRLYLECPGELSPDELDDTDEVIMAEGMAHEKRFLEAIKQDDRTVIEISEGDKAISDTIDAMQCGADVIYQATLSHPPFTGYADFLIRVDGASKLGPYHYEVWDTKLARREKPYFLIQLCCYAEMLDAVQGRRPESVSVVLGTNERRTFRTEDYFYYYLLLKQAFLGAMAGFDPEARPVPDLGANHGRWTSYAEAYVLENDHLVQVAGITSSQIKKLNTDGVTTMKALGMCELPQIPKVHDDTFTRLKHQARLQTESKGLDKPLFDIITPDPQDPRRGLAILPPPSDMDVFFDIEGYPLIEDGLEYLFGATYLDLDTQQPTFCDWWAHDKHQERCADRG